MMDSLFELTDEFGPAKIVHLIDPRVGLRAIVVIDSVACGPAIGGTRMAPDVSVLECARLARAMTFKNAAAGLAHGGAKSVIFADPAMPAANKERLMRGFACAIKELTDYIPGPDMGTDETSMAWVQDEIGRAVGLPQVLGGIPLDEIGATGLGVAVAAVAAQAYCDVTIRGARVAVQGFGAVGEHTARQLAKRGAVLVAAADSQATVVSEHGIDIDALAQTKHQTGLLSAHPGVKVFARDQIVGVECDVWVPAARPDVVTIDNVDQIKARLIVQGANIPVTERAERVLHKRGVLSIPDFIANAGGVICADVEYHGGTKATALESIQEKVNANTLEVLRLARETNTEPRVSATTLAKTRLTEAMALRRWHAAKRQSA